MGVVTSQMEKRLTAGAHMSRKNIMISNFLGGLAWGLGTVIGATVVVGILVWVLSLFNFIPIIGDFVGGAVEQVNIKTEKSK